MVLYGFYSTRSVSSVLLWRVLYCYSLTVSDWSYNGSLLPYKRGLILVLQGFYTTILYYKGFIT